jgi:hypothetical protein
MQSVSTRASLQPFGAGACKNTGASDVASTRPLSDTAPKRKKDSVVATIASFASSAWPAALPVFYGSQSGSAEVRVSWWLPDHLISASPPPLSPTPHPHPPPPPRPRPPLALLWQDVAQRVAREGRRRGLDAYAAPLSALDAAGLASEVRARPHIWSTASSFAGCLNLAPPRCVRALASFSASSSL